MRRLRKKIKKMEEKTTAKEAQQLEPAESQERELCREVELLSSPQDIVKKLAVRVFTREELITKSISGKRSAKSSESPRPALDPVKLSQIEHIARKKGVEHRSFIEKLQNLQKVLRRK